MAMALSSTPSRRRAVPTNTESMSVSRAPPVTAELRLRDRDSSRLTPCRRRRPSQSYTYDDCRNCSFPSSPLDLNATSRAISSTDFWKQCCKSSGFRVFRTIPPGRLQLGQNVVFSIKPLWLPYCSFRDVKNIKFNPIPTSGIIVGDSFLLSRCSLAPAIVAFHILDNTIEIFYVELQPCYYEPQLEKDLVL